MIELIKTPEFKAWFDWLPDDRAYARIQMRLDRLAEGNPGDFRVLGGGLNELRIDYGPGYRIYYLRAGKAVILLLCGGDKRTQSRDISRAQMLAKQYKES